MKLHNQRKGAVCCAGVHGCSTRLHLLIALQTAPGSPPCPLCHRVSAGKVRTWAVARMAKSAVMRSRRVTWAAQKTSTSAAPPPPTLLLGRTVQQAPAP